MIFHNRYRQKAPPNDCDHSNEKSNTQQKRYRNKLCRLPEQQADIRTVGRWNVQQFLVTMEIQTCLYVQYTDTHKHTYTVIISKDTYSWLDLPDVGGRGEEAVEERFRSHPSYRQHRTSRNPVVVLLGHAPSHAKVS